MGRKRKQAETDPLEVDPLGSVQPVGAGDGDEWHPSDEDEADANDDEDEQADDDDTPAQPLSTGKAG